MMSRENGFRRVGGGGAFRGAGGRAALAAVLTGGLGLLLGFYVYATRVRDSSAAQAPPAAPATSPSTIRLPDPASPEGALSTPADPVPRAAPTPSAGGGPASAPPPASPAPDPPPPPAGPDESARKRQAIFEEARRLEAEGKTAADAQRHEAALEAFAAADALLRSLAEGEEREAARARLAKLADETTRGRDEKRRRDREAQFERRWADVRKLAEETNADAWDEAIERAEAIERDFPDKADAAKDLLAPLRKKRDDADAYIQKQIRQADEALPRSQFGVAFEALRKARIWKQKDARLDQAGQRVRAAIAARDLVRIPAGPFLQGSEEPKDANPRRNASTGEFLIDRCEVTNEVYAWFCEDTGHPAPPTWAGRRAPPVGRAFYPVTGVTCADAEAFARWLGKRLPTEAEWEKAARGVEGRVYPWGDGMPSPPPCRCSASPADGPDAETGPVPAGRMEAGKSPFGVLDMAGNVWEWTAGRAPVPDEPSVEGRVLRGGSFASGPDGLRCARRYIERPDVKLMDVGFRCVRDP